MLHNWIRLPLRELLPATRLVEADLFAFDFASIPRYETSLGKCWLERGIIGNQRPGDPVPHCAGLSGLATAADIDQNVEGRQLLDKLERLADDHAPRLAREELINRLAIDDEAAAAAFHENTRYRAFPPTSAIEIVISHCDPLEFQNFRLLGSMWMSGARVALHFL